MYCVTVQLVVIVHGDVNYLCSFRAVFVVVLGSRGTFLVRRRELLSVIVQTVVCVCWAPGPRILPALTGVRNCWWEDGVAALHSADPHISPLLNMYLT